MRDFIVLSGIYSRRLLAHLFLSHGRDEKEDVLIRFFSLQFRVKEIYCFAFSYENISRRPYLSHWC